MEAPFSAAVPRTRTSEASRERRRRSIERRSAVTASMPFDLATGRHVLAVEIDLHKQHEQCLVDLFGKCALPLVSSTTHPTTASRCCGHHRRSTTAVERCRACRCRHPPRFGGLGWHGPPRATRDQRSFESSMASSVISLGQGRAACAHRPAPAIERGSNCLPGCCYGESFRLPRSTRARSGSSGSNQAHRDQRRISRSRNGHRSPTPVHLLGRELRLGSGECGAAGMPTLTIAVALVHTPWSMPCSRVLSRRHRRRLSHPPRLEMTLATSQNAWPKCPSKQVLAKGARRWASRSPSLPNLVDAIHVPSPPL